MDTKPEKGGYGRYKKGRGVKALQEEITGREGDGGREGWRMRE